MTMRALVEAIHHKLLATYHHSNEVVVDEEGKVVVRTVRHSEWSRTATEADVAVLVQRVADIATDILVHEGVMTPPRANWFQSFVKKLSAQPLAEQEK